MTDSRAARPKGASGSVSKTYSGPELCALTAREVVGLLERGEVSPADLVTASSQRIDQTTPAINAMITRCDGRAMEAAADAKSLAQTPLRGIPIGIKDLTPVAGVRTTWGTPAFADHVPVASDPLVTRLERRGALVMGKTNTPEMGAGANTFNAVFGMTRNPHDTRLNAGGSSGGAAAGLAVGEVWLSHGSDLGGSLRTPASYCGVVGMRTTPGRVVSGGSADSFNPFGVEGPMARNVGDLALFLDAMAGADPVSPLAYPAPDTGFLAQYDTAPGDIRIAFSPDLGGLAPVEPEMAALLAHAMAGAEGADLTVADHTPAIGGLDHAFRTFRALGMWTSAKVTPKRVSDQFKPTLKANIAQGGQLTVDDLAEANVTRSRIYAAMLALFETYDVLACPVTGLAPLPVEVEFPPQVAGVASRDYLDWLSFAFLATVCGLPAMSLPCGFTAAGMPIGIQLIGPPRGEGRLLQVTRRLEDTFALPQRPIDPNQTHIAA